MPLDPSTLCARTAVGDAELAAPRHGLAIAQRRLLSLLDHPAPLDELARRPGVLPDRLEKDLARLAEHGLVELHGPSAPMPPGPAAKAPSLRAVPRKDVARPWTPAQPGIATAGIATPPETRLVLGRRVRRGRALGLGFLTLVGVGAVAWWVASPREPTREAVAATAPAPAPAPVPVRRTDPTPPPAPLPEPVRVVSPPESFVTSPAPAVPAAAPAVAPVTPAASSRPSLPAPAGTKSADAFPVAAPVVKATPPSSELPPTARPEATAVRAEAPPAVPPLSVPPVTPPTTVPAAPAAPPPVQLAAATPSTLPARAVSRRVEPLTREEPDFPRDALASGITKGVVRARLSIDAAGKVTGVEILDAQPRRVFDRSVSRALARWTYEPGDAARTTEVEVAFSRE